MEACIGLDVGTGGVRACLVDAEGRLLASAERPLEARREGVLFEQDPGQWWREAMACLRALARRAHRVNVRAISVAATSGTVLLVDAEGEPLLPAIMYSDGRAQAEAAELNEALAGQCARLGYRFHPSWGLPKLLWLRRHRPDLWRCGRIAHAADYLLERLSGVMGVTDWTQALKSGYDVAELRWPAEVARLLELPLERLPQVVAPGTPLGTLRQSVSEALGLPRDVIVVAGMTDGCASQLAAGSVSPGEWLTVLGTTMVIKGVSRQLLRDPAGRIYHHRHPLGWWLPGAASNTGGEALELWARARLPELDAAAASRIPTGLICYPLRRQGERFPFVCSHARGFCEGIVLDEEVLYATTLEGVSFLERLAYELLASLGATMEGGILTAGGGAHSRTWCAIRASVLGRPVLVARHTGAAYGAAVLAAGATVHRGLEEATRTMARPAASFDPDPRLEAGYGEQYQRFLEALRQRGYI
ncbi:carbohydrate kinase FGGY [Thermobaculum terrenum ATCC BAA-798]|uniref:Carbohydrate kinase FGGY n=1 Tax=Thermobaculum terrenum (strain ATCC BAA-798 / CCMEE 7001 / YNP1) TaxID=525904 RepID=D1CI12_THET1|nr:FGGY family carbohydrate kinase [Thermobaculum terrenum]ACZ43383.1 carbohydrate kinase FGGY [Thermobaculum terrenum ATCC BAA-798]